MRPAAVSAPGKLILMGEHAVVYGRPALVAAIDLRLTASLTPLPHSAVRLDLPGLAPRGSFEETSWEALAAYARAVRERWSSYARQPRPEGFRALRGDDPAHVVKAALGEAAEALAAGASPRALGGVALRIDSQLPIGSGFGSSAATATAVIAACLAGFAPEGIDPVRLERLALEVERRQHGLPSGVDGATILHGGVVWARRLPEGVAGEPGGLEIAPIGVRSPVLSRLRVYDTGTPAEATGAVVAAVRALHDRQPSRIGALLDRMAAATRDFRAGLEDPDDDPDRTLHLLREHEACLEGLGVVPEEVRGVIRRVEAEGGAAKISGAGSLRGPGAGSLLVYHPDPQRIAGWWFLHAFPFYAVHLGAPGLRQES